MRKGDIDRYFREVARVMNLPVSVYLTGGVASWFMGGGRPTRDIDFGFRVSGRGAGSVGPLLGAVSERMGIPVQFSEDISRWGMIDLPDYEKKATFYKRFGKVSVYLLDVGSWSIGKLSRYYESDVSDLVAVLKRQRPNPRGLLKLWAHALKKSPRSSEQFLFVRNIQDFMNHYSAKIWGRRIDAKELLTSSSTRLP